MTQPRLRKTSPNEASAYPNRLPGRRPPPRLSYPLTLDGPRLSARRTRAALPGTLRGRSQRDPSAELPPEKPQQQSIMAGRVAQELSRKPVRFLWQTDAADRFLFVSPGLIQVVGRNADVVGERWQEVAARLQLDPGGRIARALRQRDTWSGLSVWWPIEGSNVRVPVELTALPVFAGDQSFQGYRGFGILRPAEALMPATFEARFGANAPPAEQVPPYEECRRQPDAQRRSHPLRHGADCGPHAHAAGAERLRGDRGSPPRAGGRPAKRNSTLPRRPRGKRRRLSYLLPSRRA